VAFRRFGPLVVDWPHKAESKSYFPPKGILVTSFLLGIVNSVNSFKVIVLEETAHCVFRGHSELYLWKFLYFSSDIY